MRLLARLWVVFAVSFAAGAPLRIGNGIEPQDLDPQRIWGNPESQIIRSLFEGLVVRDPRTSGMLPGVASKWRTSRDGLKWTFTLRHDAKWTNGEPVTAADFVYAWTRLLSPATAAPRADLAYCIKNARRFNRGELRDPKQLGIRAAAPDRLVVTLERPAPFFAELVEQVAFYPVHRATVEKHGVRWTRPENIVSNGAFRLAEWAPYKVIRVTRNATYWDRDRVALTEIHFLPIESLETQEKMFRAGQLDVTGGIPPEKLATWRADASGAFQSVQAEGVALYRFNTRRPPLDDVRVRRALALAVDRSKLVKHVTGGQVPSASFVPPGIGNYRSPASVPVDDSGFAEAKKLLAAAGYGPGGKPLEIEILITKAELYVKTAEAIQYMWKKNLGVEARLVTKEWKVFLDAIRLGDYQICRTNWLMDYHDPEAYLENWLSDAAGNNTGFASREFDRLFRQAIHQADPRRRVDLFRRAESILMKELPLIPLYVTELFYLRNPAVENWFPNPHSVHPLKFVRLLK